MACFANQLAEQVRFDNLTSPTHVIETAATQLRPIEQLADWDSSELPAWPRARRTG